MEQIFYTSAADAAHLGGLVLWYGLGRLVVSNYLKIINLSVFVLLAWRFVFGINARQEGHEWPLSAQMSSRFVGLIKMLLSDF